MLPSWIYGHRTGEIYTTKAGSPPDGCIIHAATMVYPGMRARISTVEKLLPLIVEECKKQKGTSLAIPILGTGTGGLKVSEVVQLYEHFFKSVTDIEILIVQYQ